jgi:hypothetical protein
LAAGVRRLSIVDRERRIDTSGFNPPFLSSWPFLREGTGTDQSNHRLSSADFETAKIGRTRDRPPANVEDLTCAIEAPLQLGPSADIAL